MSTLCIYFCALFSCCLGWRDAGYSILVLDDEEELRSCPEVTRMRGYKLIPHEEASVQTECGKEGPVVFTSDDWSRLR